MTDDQGLMEIRKRKARQLQELLEKGGEGDQAPDKPLGTDDASLQGIISKYDLVIVDMWGPWCGQCKIVGPVIESLVPKYRGRAVFVNVNVDRSPYISRQFAIQSIPTLLTFKSGKLVDRSVGAIPQRALERVIEPFMRDATPLE